MNRMFQMWSKSSDFFNPPISFHLSNYISKAFVTLKLCKIAKCPNYRLPTGFSTASVCVLVFLLILWWSRNFDSHFRDCFRSSWPLTAYFFCISSHYSQTASDVMKSLVLLRRFSSLWEHFPMQFSKDASFCEIQRSYKALEPREAIYVYCTCLGKC